MAPRTDQRGEAGYRSYCIAATVYPLQTIVHPYRSGLPAGEGRTIVLRQRLNFCHRNTADLRSAFGWPLHSPCFQALPPAGVTGNVVMVQLVVGNQFMHQGQSQGCVGARQQGNVFVAFLSGLSAPGIDANDFGAIAFRSLHMAPEVQVAGNGVTTPDQDQFGLSKELYPHAHLGT